MTHYPDGSPYGYLDEAAEPGLVNAGWLDASAPYRRGEVPPAFVTALAERCRRPVHLTRGWHECDLCPPDDSPFPQPTTVRRPDGDLTLGHGEIRVTAPDGTRWAAPDLILHYVIDHGYRPPDGFVAALAPPAPA